MPDESLAAAMAALEGGRWREAHDAFAASLAHGETAEAAAGMASALWWSGEPVASLTFGARAYALFRRQRDVPGAVRCAVQMAITYKADLANPSAASGWTARAERLLEAVDPGVLHGWIWIARAYRMADFDEAEELTVRALDIARSEAAADLELTALAQLGRITVGRGATVSGFALLDEAMAGALAGETANLDTVVYVCCDMLNACEVADDLARSAQWCQVADEFVQTYGCPFLHAECRIAYGTVLSTKGRWDDADRELAAGVRIAGGSSPALHARGLSRLAALRVRQGRLEDAEQLLSLAGDGVELEAETALSRAALLLARGDGRAASDTLQQRLHRLAAARVQLAAALELMLDAALDCGDMGAARSAVARLREHAGGIDDDRIGAMALTAEGRLASAGGDVEEGRRRLDAALGAWVRLDLPYEAARARDELGRLAARTRRDVAVDHFRHALAGFEQLGARRDADRVAAALRGLGVARPGPKRMDVLTVREQQVLRLLAAGLSNPEIAERLHISRKTASHHVSRILGKLNLRNRVEAAAYAASSG